MARITVIGGAGYAGGHIVREAVDRGHEVTSISRNLPAEPLDGVTYAQGDIRDTAELVANTSNADVVIVAVAPRGDMAGGVTRTAIREYLAALPANVRAGVVGGAGGSLVAPGGARVLDHDFPEEYLAEALEMSDVLADLVATGNAHDWFLIHPAGVFGPWAEGERTGSYRTGGDVIVTDAEGNSQIGGADFAIAVLDEVEQPAHIGRRFTVGY